MNIARAGTDGDAHAGTQNITVPMSGVSKTGEQLRDEIIEAAERKGAAGGATFSIRTG